jgi:hypothetical protein
MKILKGLGYIALGTITFTIGAVIFVPALMGVIGKGTYNMIRNKEC